MILWQGNDVALFRKPHSGIEPGACNGVVMKGWIFYVLLVLFFLFKWLYLPK